MKTIDKQVTKTEKITVFEVGDKVRVVEAPIGFRSYFEAGEFKGIREITDVSEDGDFRVKDTTGYPIPFDFEEMYKCELVKSKPFELHIMEGRRPNQLLICETSKKIDELMTIQQEGDSIEIELWDTENFNVESVEGLSSTGFRKGLIKLTRK